MVRIVKINVEEAQKWNKKRLETITYFKRIKVEKAKKK